MIELLLYVALAVLVIVVIRRFSPKFMSSGDLDPRTTTPRSMPVSDRSSSTTASVITTQKPWWKKFGGWFWYKVKENWIAVTQLVGGSIACHFFIWYFWPKWYTLMARNPVFWIDHFVVILTFLFLRKPGKDKTPKLRLIGSLLLFILFAGTVYTIIRWNWPELWEENKPSTSERMEIRPSPTIASNTPTTNIEGERKVREFWEKHLTEKADVDEMVEIARLESDFNQFDPSDKTKPYLHYNDDKYKTIDVGVMQINSKSWNDELALPNAPPEIKTYNLEIWEGNMAAALFKRQKYGAKNWSTYKMARLVLNGTPYTIEAPVEGWSSKVPSVTGLKLSITYSGNVMTKDDEGEAYPDGPGIFVGIKKTKYSRYQSRTGKIETVFVTPFK